MYLFQAEGCLVLSLPSQKVNSLSAGCPYPSPRVIAMYLARVLE